MIINKVLHTIHTYQMISPGDHVIAAVSGGADSVALLSILCRLKQRWHLTLTVAHLNHMLRGAAAQQDARFVAALAERLGLECIIEDRDVRAYQHQVSCSVQEAARAVRYSFLNELRERLGAQKVALGHTANDQAETILMWLIRGTSAAGLAGIPPVRNKHFIRPLITVTRAEIETYLHQQQITFIPDSSASEQHYLRNKIRHHLIPLLEQIFNPQIVRTVNRLGTLVQQDNEILDSLVQELVASLVPEAENGSLILPVSDIQQYPAGLRGRIIKALIARVTNRSRGIYFRHIEALQQLLTATGPAKKIQLPDGWTVMREYDALIITREKVPQNYFCYTFDHIPARIIIPELGRTIILSREDFSWSDRTVVLSDHHGNYLDYDRVAAPVTVRNYQPGDRFYPLGLGGSKKLKDFFIDNKIPPRKRHNIPIILFQDNIAWVGGLRIDERFRITPATRNVLKIQLLATDS